MSHAFSFFRAGGFNQVSLAKGADLINLESLDQKLWVALACPTQGLVFDERTLSLIDSDGDGRIRANELIAAFKWAGSMLVDPEILIQAPAILPLAAINTANPAGAALEQAARTVLKGLGKAEADSISIAESMDAVTAFNKMPFNGDGIITQAAAEDDTQKQLIADILATTGGEADMSGEQGVSKASVNTFSDTIAAYLAWHAKGDQDEALKPLQGDTAGALAALQKVREKIDDFFVRMKLAAFDSRAIAALNREEKEYYAIAARDLALDNSEILALPLAHVDTGSTLPLKKGLNPAWLTAMEEFVSKVVTPMLGECETLEENQWNMLKTTLLQFSAWANSNPGPMLESLPLERLEALNAAGMQSLLDSLFDKEQAQAGTAEGIASIERLVRYVRDLHRLAENFVNFREFYNQKDMAIFQAGTLYLDRRSTNLCVRVEDAAKHATMAPMSRTYLAYCDCVRKATGQKITIAAALTNGDADSLMVGRNGIFYDRNGNDWDATIIRVVENPISLREAFWSPYKKLVRFIEEQVAKRAAASEAASDAMLQKAATSAGTAASTGKAEGIAPKKLDIGVVAALGVAVGGITAALGALLETFFGLGIWMPLGIIGLMLVISGPSMLIAWLKLRQRNVGPLLEANGWAINSLARINVPFGTSLTRIGVLPKGATVNLADPFADKGSPWSLYLILILIIAAGLYYFLPVAG